MGRSRYSGTVIGCHKVIGATSPVVTLEQWRQHPMVESQMSPFCSNMTNRVLKDMETMGNNGLESGLACSESWPLPRQVLCPTSVCVTSQMCFWKNGQKSPVDSLPRRRCCYSYRGWLMSHPGLWFKNGVPLCLYAKSRQVSEYSWRYSVYDWDDIIIIVLNYLNWCIYPNLQYSFNNLFTNL